MNNYDLIMPVLKTVLLDFIVKFQQIFTVSRLYIFTIMKRHYLNVVYFMVTSDVLI